MGRIMSKVCNKNNEVRGPQRNERLQINDFKHSRLCFRLTSRSHFGKTKYMLDDLGAKWTNV